MSYKSGDPAEWTDAQGQVHSRWYTNAEKKERQKRTIRAAALGAAAGAGAGLGGSALRRGVIAQTEERELPKVMDQHLSTLRKKVAERQKHLDAAIVQKDVRFQKKRLANAQQTLAEEEGEIKKLLQTASGERRKQPFGGITWGKRPGEAATGTGESTNTNWNERTTHLGLVHKRYNDLAKTRGLPGFNPDTSNQLFDNLISQKDFQKKAMVMEAFLREATQILGA